MTTISPLRQSDEVSVRPWARDYLRDYLRQRADAFGLAIDDETLDAHIDDNELESALWHDVVHADYAETEFVGVARKGQQPLGLILVSEKLEPYLRVPVGFLRWVYVIPEARRQGVAKALLGSADTWMSSRGIKAREAQIPAANSARQLYEAAGFTATEVHLGAPPPTT